MFIEVICARLGEDLLRCHPRNSVTAGTTRYGTPDMYWPTRNTLVNPNSHMEQQTSTLISQKNTHMPILKTQPGSTNTSLSHLSLGNAPHPSPSIRGHSTRYTDTRVTVEDGEDNDYNEFRVIAGIKLPLHGTPGTYTHVLSRAGDDPSDSSTLSSSLESEDSIGNIGSSQPNSVQSGFDSPVRQTLKQSDARSSEHRPIHPSIRSESLPQPSDYMHGAFHSDSDSSRWPVINPTIQENTRYDDGSPLDEILLFMVENSELPSPGPMDERHSQEAAFPRDEENAAVDQRDEWEEGENQSQAVPGKDDDDDFSEDEQLDILEEIQEAIENDRIRQPSIDHYTQDESFYRRKKKRPSNKKMATLSFGDMANRFRILRKIMKQLRDWVQAISTAAVKDVMKELKTRLSLDPTRLNDALVDEVTAEVLNSNKFKPGDRRQFYSVMQKRTGFTLKLLIVARTAVSRLLPIQMPIIAWYVRSCDGLEI